MNRLYGSLFLCALVLCMSSNGWAGPLRKAAEAVGGAANYVGETVGDTASAVGGTIKDAAQNITGNNDPLQTKREIDAIALKTVKTVTSQSKDALNLFEKSYGYAVFDSRKASILITTGKGIGVAVRKDTGERTYMHVASAGVNVGAGIQFYQGLFLFENKGAFDTFVNKGWQADATAAATLGKTSLEAQAKFTNGMAYYQISETGIMLDADLTGTKYWKSEEINKVAQLPQ